VVGPGDHLRCLGAAPLIACGGLLGDSGLHEGSPVGGGQVGQLERQLGVLDYGIRQHLLVPVPYVVPLLDHLSISGDVGAAAEEVAGSDMLQVEQLAMFVTLVTEPKVDTRAVLGGRPDEVSHDLRDVEGQLSLGLRGHVCEPAGGCEGGSIAGPLRSTAGVDLLTAFLGLLLPGWGSLEGHPPTDLDLLLPLGL
jgi:hypothetical protein